MVACGAKESKKKLLTYVNRKSPQLIQRGANIELEKTTMQDYTKNNSPPKIYWVTKTQYVDIATGEELSKKEAETKYIIIKKQKHVRIEQKEHYKQGYISILYECDRSKQQELF